MVIGLDVYLSEMLLHRNNTFSHFSVSSLQCCAGFDEPLCTAVGVGARPARSSALQTQTLRSWRHKSWSDGRGKELVRTWKCQFQQVQGEYTVPLWQKNVSLSQSNFIYLKLWLHFYILLKEHFNFSQENSGFDPGTLVHGQRESSAADWLVVSGRIRGSSWIFRADRNPCRTPDPESDVQTAKIWRANGLQQSTGECKGGK